MDRARGALDQDRQSAFSPWRRVQATPPPGPDDPVPQNVADLGGYIAFFDSPGPNQGNRLYTGASRIHVVQNFTA
jgi:hypothetical protein